MAINISNNDPRIHYAATAGQTLFTIPFSIFDDNDLLVYVNDVLKSITSDYTIANSEVTLLSAASLNDKIALTRNVPIERTTDLASSYSANAIDDQLDRIVSQIADLDDKADRTIQISDSELAPSMLLTSDRKGKVMAFNETTGAVEAGPTISDVQSVANAAADIQTLAHIEDGTDATDAIQTVAGISANVTTVGGIAANVTSVAGNASNINTVAGINANVTTVAGISADVTTVAGKAALITTDFVSDLNALAVADVISDINLLATSDIVSDLNALATSDIISDLNTLATSDIVSDINTLATNDIVGDLNLLATSDFVADLNMVATSANLSNLNTAAGAVSNVNTVAGISSDVTTVSGISSAVSTVAADATDIGVVSTNISNVNAVAGNTTNVNAVATNATNINTVAADATDIGVVSGISSDVSTVSGLSSNVTTVAGISGNVTTVAGISANVTAVAGDAADIGTVATDLAGSDNIGTVAGSISNVNTVGGAISNVNTVATNLSSVNDFAARYRSGATDPTSNNDEGDLFYNTTSDSLKVYTGSAWEQGVTAGSGFLPLTGGGLTGDLSFSGTQTVDGRDLSVDGTKLDGIEASATADQSDAEIRAAVEAATDSNVFTDDDHTKLNAIEASADVTDTVNVVAALTAGSNITIASDGTIAGAAQYTHPTHAGDDAAIDTGALSGATVISDLDFNITTDTLGHVTDANATVATRNLTLANLGYTGATNANYITNNNQLSNGAGYTTSVGDITGVTAGTNLTGGGTSGGVTVNLTASPNITSLSVGSSEVISSTRQLKNIASVDATTVAALGAAGVGGGGSLEFTASETITAGDLVGLDNLGKVKPVEAGFTGEYYWNSLGGHLTGTPGLQTAYSPTDDKFIMVWRQSSGGPAGIFAVVADVASNGTITVGSKIQIAFGWGGQDMGNITYIPAQNAFIIAWTQQGDQNHADTGGQVRAVKINGNGLTMGSSVRTMPYVFNSELPVDVGVGYSGGSSAIVQYGDYWGSNSHAQGMTLSGTTISLGTRRDVGANNHRERRTIAYDSTAGKPIIVYGTTSSKIFRLCTMSGSTLTLGNTVSLSGDMKIDHNGVHDTVSGKTVFGVQDVANSNYASAVVATVSGSSISLGSVTEVTQPAKAAERIGVATDGSGNMFFSMRVTGQGSNQGPEYLRTTLSGTAVVSSPATQAVPTSEADDVAQPFYVPSTGKYVMVYEVDDGSGTAPAARAVNPAGGIATWIGIAAENIASGSAGEITVVGGINEQQSGLQIGSSYGLVPATAALTLAAEPKIGIAISATKLFITTGGVT